MTNNQRFAAELMVLLSIGTVIFSHAETKQGNITPSNSSDVINAKVIKADQIEVGTSIKVGDREDQNVTINPGAVNIHSFSVLRINRQDQVHKGHSKLDGQKLSVYGEDNVEANIGVDRGNHPEMRLEGRSNKEFKQNMSAYESELITSVNTDQDGGPIISMVNKNGQALLLNMLEGKIVISFEKEEDKENVVIQSDKDGSPLIELTSKSGKKRTIRP